MILYIYFLYHIIWYVYHTGFRKDASCSNKPARSEDGWHQNDETWTCVTWRNKVKPELSVARTDISCLCTLWLCQNSYWKCPFIVDFPIKNGGSFHSYVSLPEGNVFSWCLYACVQVAGTDSAPLFAFPCRSRFCLPSHLFRNSATKKDGTRKKQ